MPKPKGKGQKGKRRPTPSLDSFTEGERRLLQLALRVRSLDDLMNMARASVEKYGTTAAEAAAAQNSEDALSAAKPVEAALWFAIAWIIRESAKAREKPRMN
jgi:hypothetical protein